MSARPPETRFDDPEDHPPDEESGLAPGDPAHTTEGWDVNVTQQAQFTGDRRARRRSAIEDHLRTRDYRERLKEQRRFR